MPIINIKLPQISSPVINNTRLSCDKNCYDPEDQDVMCTPLKNLDKKHFGPRSLVMGAVSSFN